MFSHTINHLSRLGALVRFEALLHEFVNSSNICSRLVLHINLVFHSYALSPRKPSPHLVIIANLQRDRTNFLIDLHRVNLGTVDMTITQTLRIVFRFGGIDPDSGKELEAARRCDRGHDPH